MAASPVSKLAETGQDKKADQIRNEMAAQQKFVMDSVCRMEEANRAMMDMVSRNISQDQPRGIN